MWLGRSVFYGYSTAEHLSQSNTISIIKNVANATLFLNFLFKVSPCVSPLFDIFLFFQYKKTTHFRRVIFFSLFSFHENRYLAYANSLIIESSLFFSFSLVSHFFLSITATILLHLLISSREAWKYQLSPRPDHQEPTHFTHSAV